MVLVWNRVPPPHVAVHVEFADQADQTQLTGAATGTGTGVGVRTGGKPAHVGGVQVGVKVPGLELTPLHMRLAGVHPREIGFGDRTNSNCVNGIFLVPLLISVIIEANPGSDIPEIKAVDPWSAKIKPYFFKALKNT